MGDTLHFSYEMNLEFSGDVVNHYFSVRIKPKSNLRQQILWAEYEITPVEEQATEEDGFGNQVLYGSYFSPHRQFQIQMKGEAVTRSHGPEERASKEEVLLYKYASTCTVPGEQLISYYKEIQKKLPKDSPLVAAEYVMGQLRTVFRYEKGRTTVATTAEMAFHQKCGVCQDYAHILITLLRMADIPARYIVGMMIGDGESHAWVEVYEAGAWYAIDPTNGLWVDETYIKISSGRDYNDCIISQGMFEGMVSQKQSIGVSVWKERGGGQVW